MPAKIAKTRPISGEFEELVFGSGDQALWVHFEDQEFQEFYGVFARGMTSFCAVKQIGDTALIISFGQVYLFDIKRRKLLLQPSIDQAQGVWVNEATGHYIVADYCELYVFSQKGLVWESDRISYDGICIERIVGNSVYGTVFDLRDYPEFSLDLSSFRYDCSWSYVDDKRFEVDQSCVPTTLKEPVVLRNFKHLQDDSGGSNMLLMPDLSITTETDKVDFTGYAHYYKNAWLSIWADNDSIYMTHKGQSTDITGCKGKFRLSFRNLFDFLHRRFVLKRGRKVVAEYETSLEAAYFTDITYDMIDFEADNFFAWVKYVLETEDPVAFIRATKPFKPDA